MTRLQEISKKTLEKTKEYLNKYGRCFVVRPTGFGKSYMLSHLSMEYERSLYVYPLDIIKNSVIETYGPTGYNVLKNVDFISYQKLNNLYKEGKIVELISQYNIVMLDEAHMAGAEGFRRLFEDIDKLFSRSKVHLVGVTATPDRADNFDVKFEYFKGKEIFKYELHNCVKDGIMKAPHYRRGVFDMDNAINSSIDIANKIRTKNGQVLIDDNEKYKIAQEANILNAADIIQRGIEDVYGTTRDYLKFIVFFPNAQSIRDRQREVELWFEDKYKGFDVNTVVIHSDRSDDNVEGIDVLEDLKYKSRTVHLIMCIDMLNMGYHVSDITGVIMLRSTRSDIIYKQQIGRCLSVKSEYPALIIDLVDNISIKPYFMKDEKDRLSTGSGQAQPVERNMFKGGESIILKDEVAAFNTLVGRLGYAPEISRTQSIVWWYKNRQAPLYVIEDRFKIKRQDLIKLLDKAGVDVDDESGIKDNITPKDVSRRLYRKRA